MKRALLASTILAAMALASPQARAEIVEKTTTTTTTVMAPEPLIKRAVVLSDFDINSDRVLTLREVGDKLFNVYDEDGNEVIDNLEYANNKAVITVTPREVETVTFTDYDEDGLPDKRTYKYDVFMEKSLLSRFDANADGLSPEELIGRHFNEVDQDNNRMISLKEWRATYDAVLKSTLTEKTRFN